MQNYKTRKWGLRLLPPVLIIRIMKLTAVFLLAISVSVSANGYSQDVTLNFSRTSLEKIFNEIRKQTGYVFFYKTDLLKDLPKVKVKVTNASISEAMDASVLNLPLTYTIIDKTIVLSAKKITDEKKNNGAKFSSRRYTDKGQGDKWRRSSFNWRFGEVKGYFYWNNNK